MADPEQTWSTIRAPNGGGIRTVAMAFAAFHKDLTKYEVRHPFFAPAFLRATDLAIRAAFAGHDPLAKALRAELFPLPVPSPIRPPAWNSTSSTLPIWQPLLSPRWPRRWTGGTLRLTRRDPKRRRC